MKTLMICFSQTGNTRRIAEHICKGIIEVNGQCDLVALKEVNIEILSAYQLVGIGCPVYYHKEPFNVSDFITSLPDLKGQHWFVFCTHGNVIGNFFPSISKKLAERDATIIGFHNSYASIAVPFYPSPSYTSGHPDSHDLNRAEVFGREIVTFSQQITTGRQVRIPEPGPVSSEEWIKAAYATTPEFLDQFMPKLSINSEKCTKCAICQDSCPVDGIDIEADPPRIQSPCIYCWNCTIVCPEQAIYADWEKLVQMAPEYYRRYRVVLEEVAAKGEFRWLIDPDSIRFDDPLYKQLARKSQANS